MRVVVFFVLTGVLALGIGVAAAPSLGLAKRTSADPVIAAAGDIACSPSYPDFNNGNGTATTCRQKWVANVIDTLGTVDAVLPLGDEQYDHGGYSAFTRSYELSWGRFNSIARPVPGNHEYDDLGDPVDPTGTYPAAGYYAYFGAAAGDPNKGYYSYDLGSWHLIALNAQCSFIGGCGMGSPEELWLKSDLAATSKSCVLAYWHQPRFSSGDHNNDPTYDAFWRDLYARGADVILNGHDHDYERFGLQNPDEQLTSNGIREFVVGTGGADLVFFSTTQPTTEVRTRKTFGVLKLVLHPGSYDWNFAVESTTEASGFSDSGTQACSAGPTAATVAGFSAVTVGRSVRIRWQTGTEAGIAGFSLHREVEGRSVRLNRALIQAVGTVAGHRYSWVDHSHTAGPARYVLDVVGTDGTVRRAGAVTITR